MWVARRTGEPFVERASNRAWGVNIYGARTPDFNLEEHWHGYEAQLDAALERIRDARAFIDAATWLHVLVPFVASQLIRTPDHAVWLQPDARELLEGRWPDDVASRMGGRVVHLQRLLGPVAVSRWRVVRASPGDRFIMNDRGWAVFALPNELPGALLPIDPQRALLVTPMLSRVVLMAQMQRWVGLLGTVELDAGDMHRMNEAIARYALFEIYASDRQLVEKYRGHVPDYDDVAIGHPIRLISEHVAKPGEFDWHRLAALVTHEPATVLNHNFHSGIDFDGLAKSAHKPFMFVPLNTPSMQSSGLLLYRDSFLGWAVFMAAFLDAWVVANPDPSERYEWLVGAQMWLERARQLQYERGHSLAALLTLDDPSILVRRVAEVLHPDFFRRRVVGCAPDAASREA